MLLQRNACSPTRQDTGVCNGVGDGVCALGGCRATPRRIRLIVFQVRHFTNVWRTELMMPQLNNTHVWICVWCRAHVADSPWRWNQQILKSVIPSSRPYAGPLAFRLLSIEASPVPSAPSLRLSSLTTIYWRSGFSPLMHHMSHPSLLLQLIVIEW